MTSTTNFPVKFVRLFFQTTLSRSTMQVVTKLYNSVDGCGSFRRLVNRDPVPRRIGFTHKSCVCRGTNVSES